MALQENVLWRESAQKVEDLGFHFKYIMDAISRIVAVSGHYGELNIVKRYERFCYWFCSETLASVKVYYKKDLSSLIILKKALREENSLISFLLCVKKKGARELSSKLILKHSRMTIFFIPIISGMITTVQHQA